MPDTDNYDSSINNTLLEEAHQRTEEAGKEQAEQDSQVEANTPAKKYAPMSKEAISSLTKAHAAGKLQQMSDAASAQPTVTPPGNQLSLPSYHKGGVVKEDGPALLKKGEVVIPVGSGRNSEYRKAFLKRRAEGKHKW